MTLAVEPTTRSLFGIPIRAITMAQVLDAVEDTIARRDTLTIGVVNAAKVVKMRRNDRLRQRLLACDLILADGMSVVWAARLLGQPLPERITGIDLMLRLLERGHRHSYHVYCLGATEEVLTKAVTRIVADYPGIHIAGQHHGYFGPAEEEAIANAIAAARPDILLVAMTSPKKEDFLARWGRRLNVPVCHGVGGSFDVLAGKVRRAPIGWQRAGLEWLYRLLQEPRRLWKRYLITNTLFGVMLVGELRRTGHARRRAVKRIPE